MSSNRVDAQMLRVLLIGNDPGLASLLGKLLAPNNGHAAQLLATMQVTSELQPRDLPHADAILLDLASTGGRDVQAVRRIAALAPEAPIIVLGGDDDVETAIATVAEGAQDYLVTSNLQHEALTRAVRYAVERQRVALRALSRERQSQSNLARVAAIVESTDDAVISVDAEGLLLSWNPGAERLFGYSAREAIGRHVSMLWPDDERQAAAEGLAAVLRGERAGEIEGVRLHKDGRRIEVSASICPIRNAHGCVVSAAGLIRSNSERRRAQRAERSLRVVEDQFEAARETHRRLLPQTNPRVRGFDIAGHCCPALAVGGDYYDFINLPDGRLVILVADVSSHGLAPALIMTGTRRLLRSLVSTFSDLGTMIRMANQAIEEDTERHHFVTLFAGIIDPRARTLEYVGCGQAGQLIHGASGVETLCSNAYPLGVIDDFEEPQPLTCSFREDDILLVATDGFNESESPDGHPFSVHRMLDVVSRRAEDSAAQILDHLIGAVREFCLPAVPHDDMTAVIAKVERDDGWPFQHRCRG